MPAAITCASCNRPLRVPESSLGQMVQCPLCLDEFVAQADPAAEAAARAAEPPVRRSAPKPELVAAGVPGGSDSEPPTAEAEEEAVWVEPVAEAAPPKKGARPSAEGRTLAFPVLVTRDPDRVLRGRMDAELTAGGLHLRKPRQPAAFAGVGGKARYLGANRLVVTVEGRDVELAVVKPWTSTYHLARDVAAFLNGQRDFPDGRAYDVPWYLFALPPLFVALPFAAIPFGLFTDGCLGGFLWCLLAVVLAGISFAVVMQARLMPRARLIGAGGLVGLGLAIYLLAIPLTPSYTVDASLWQTVSPPGGGFTVLMPGAPVSRPAANGNGDAAYTVHVLNPDVAFGVYTAPAPQTDNNAFQPVNSPSYQAVADAKSRLTREFSLSLLVAQRDQPGIQAGLPYHEIVFQVYSNAASSYGPGSSAGKTLVARVYVANGRVYTLTVFGPKVQAGGSDAIKFFNSLQLPPSRTPPVGPQPVGPQPPSPVGWGGLLAYWSFDNIPDLNGNLFDESGNLLQGTLRQAAVAPDGARGTAVHFNGPGSDFDYSGAGGLDFGLQGEFTFAGWVRTVSPTGVIFSQRNSFDPSAVIDLKLVNGQLTAVVWPDRKPLKRPTDAEFSAGAPVNDGKWHHFALTRRGNGISELFIDGTSGVTHAVQGANGSITTNLRFLGSEQYWIQRGGNVKNENANFTGDVDEFCVFGRALPAGDIKQLASGRP